MFEQENKFDQIEYQVNLIKYNTTLPKSEFD